MKRNCKTCTLNTTGDTIETCKRMCYLRYSAQRKNRICDLEQKISKLRQVIMEIKEITELACENFVGDKTQYDYELGEQILRKISEAERYVL